VYFSEQVQRVVKLTKNPPNYGAQGSVSNYLTNLENQNAFFGDSLRFEGILPTDKGDVIVSSQPFVSGDPATIDEIVYFFKSHEYEPVGNHCYKGDSDGVPISIFDARPDNVFKDRSSGLILPIDLQIKM
jgi:hypothetical protein